MPEDIPIFLLYEIGLLIVVSSIASEIFKRIKLPGLIGAIIAGIFIGGPGGLGLVTDLTVVNILAVLGSVLILFTIGLEFEATAFWNVSVKAFILTTSGFIVSFFAGYLTGFLLSWSAQASLLLGAIIAPSGTSVIAFVLSEERKNETNAGLTLLTACIVDDVEGILLLTIALTIATKNTFSFYDFLWIGLFSTIFILGSIYIGGRLFPSLITRFEKIFSDEVLFATLLGLGLMLAFLGTKVGLAPITGAFLMGAIIPHKRIGERLADRILMMKEVFAALFFISIGLSIDPFSIPTILPMAIVLLTFALGARVAGGIVGGMLSGFRGKLLLALSLGLAVRAEMSFIIAREAVALGIVGTEFFGLTAIVVIGSMAISLPLFSKLRKSIN